MPVHKNYHVSRKLDRCGHALIAFLIMLVVVLSVSAGNAWSDADAHTPPVPMVKPIQ